MVARRVIAAVVVCVAWLIATPAMAQEYGPAGCTTVNEIEVGGALDTTVFSTPHVQPNATVPIFLDDRLLTTVTADAQGFYSHTFRTNGNRESVFRVRAVCVGAIFGTCEQAAVRDDERLVPGESRVLVESTRPAAIAPGIFLNDQRIAIAPLDRFGNWSHTFTTPGTRADTFRVRAPCAQVRVLRLPDTGIDAALLSQVGVGLVGLGAAATVLARRRKGARAGDRA